MLVYHVTFRLLQVNRFICTLANNMTLLFALYYSQYHALSLVSGFTLFEDKYLLWATRELGYGEWRKLKASINAEPDFTFDYWMQTRSTLELRRRVNALLRVVQKGGAVMKDENDRSTIYQSQPNVIGRRRQAPTVGQDAITQPRRKKRTAAAGK
jgi:hypothetical protein